MNTLSDTMIRPMQHDKAEGFYRVWAWRLACCAVVAFGFCLSWFSGHRGLFLSDQSMVFDGAWRLIQGQVPYRDVFYPFGPITFLIQAGFFWVFGVSFSNTILSAAVLNSLAGLLVIRIVHRLLPDQRLIALLGGLLTTCWFQAPFGTLWFEQTGFFFALIALLAAVEAELLTGSRSYWFHGAAGVLMVLSTLSKQNVGILFYPVIAGVAIVARFREPRAALYRLGAQIGGFLFGVACFLLWLWRFSSPRLYYHYSIEMSRSLASERVPGLGYIVNNLLTLSIIPLHVRWCALFFVLVGIIAIAAGLLNQRSEQAKIYLIIGWIIIACIQFQQLFIMITNNDDENALPFLGLAGGLAMGLLLHWLGREDIRLSFSSGKKSFAAILSWKMARRIVVAASVLLFAVSIMRGVKTSWHRYIQQYTDDSHFEALRVNGLRDMKWGDYAFEGAPEFPETQWARQADFEAVNTWLDQHPGNFFVFPDVTILYGLHGRPSPQPWLYFQEGHSFARSELPSVDETVVTSLRRNNIHAIVLEKVSWNSHGLLLRMPKLRTWINENFAKEKDFGIFEVWTAKSS